MQNEYHYFKMIELSFAAMEPKDIPNPWFILEQVLPLMINTHLLMHTYAMQNIING